MTNRSRKSRNDVKGGAKKRTDRQPRNLNGLLTQQRLTVGGMTAFAVAFAYVAANALWYQPHVHTGAFFATRTTPEPVLPIAATGESAQQTAAVEHDEGPEGDTVIRLEQEQPIPPSRPARPDAERMSAAPTAPDFNDIPPRPAPAGTVSEEDRVRAVQTLLAGLDLYDDEIDGLNGPNTREAIEAYQIKVGLAATGRIDDDLLEELGRADLTSAPSQEVAAIAMPQPEPQQMASVEAEPQTRTDAIETSSSRAAPDALEQRIRAGLKAFGNDGIAVEGPMDDRTRAAIMEFQSLFGLEPDGRPSSEVYAKMQEIGLIN